MARTDSSIEILKKYIPMQGKNWLKIADRTYWRMTSGKYAKNQAVIRGKMKLLSRKMALSDFFSCNIKFARSNH